MHQRTNIRFATLNDAEAIALESMAEIEHGLEWRWGPQRVSKAIADPETNVAVAVNEGTMVGFGIMKYDDDVAHLLLFAVREDARRHGIGSALLIWLEQVAHVAGVRRFVVEARHDNVGARAFYLRHGYRELATVRRMYYGLVDGVRFEKVVSAEPSDADA